MNKVKVLSYIDNRIKFLESNSDASMNETVQNEVLVIELTKIKHIINYE